MTRTILFILLLSAPAFAGAGDWKSYEQGASVVSGPTPGPSTGNATTFADAGAGNSIVEATAATGIFVANQSGTATDRCISWITLEFAGSEDATDHKWKIVAQMGGRGDGQAGGELIHSCWADSIQALEVSGDCELAGLACLGIEDSASATFSLSLPAGIRVTLGNQTRSHKEDAFVLKEVKATTGAGKICRVRLDSFAKTSVEVKGTLGASHAGLYGRIYTDVEMTGTCRLPSGDTVKDTFRLDRLSTDPRWNRITEPNGGHEKQAGVPTDEPTEAEEDGTDEPPPVDAKDLEKMSPETATEDPPADTATTNEPDDDTSTGTTTADGETTGE